MLRKTLKYDLGAVWKIWLILSATVLGISVLGGLGLRDLIVTLGNEQFDGFIIFSFAAVFVTVFSLCGYVLFIELLVLFRYYQNFFTDEAYLTFTLPVKRTTLFHSKLINAYIWSSANLAVVGICALIILIIAPAGPNGRGTQLGEIMRALGKTLGLIFENANAWVYIYTFIIALILIFSSLFSSLLMYGCITLGCTMVKKYKLLAAILTYYLVNTGMSVLSYIGQLVVTTALGTSFNILYKYTEAQINVIILFTLIAVLMFFVALCVYTYKFIIKRLEGNLNLA